MPYILPMIWTVPNILTMFRIGIIPALVVLLYIQEHITGTWAAWTALGLYTLGAISDFLDGYIARSMNISSAFGRFLDPIADKLIIAALLLVLAGFDRTPGLWLIPSVVIMMREILIAGLREFLGPHKVTLPVSNLAKWKTTAQMFTMGFLIMGDAGNSVLPHTLLIGQIGLCLSAVLTVWTGWAYMVTGIAYIRTIDTQQDKG